MTQNNSRATLETILNHKQKHKQPLTINHTKIRSHIDQLIEIHKSQFVLEQCRETWHTLVFNIPKYFHDQYRKPVTCVITVGVDAVQTALPRGPDNSPESVLGTGHVRVAWVKRAELLELPTSGLPVIWFYHRVWLQCRFSVARLTQILLHIYTFGYPFLC